VIGTIRIRRLRDDVEGLLDGSAVLVGGPFHILIHDVVLAHLEMGLHTATRQAHGNLLRESYRIARARGAIPDWPIRVSRIAVRWRLSILDISTEGSDEMGDKTPKRPPKPKKPKKPAGA
jgi:hypothetical protein